MDFIRTCSCRSCWKFTKMNVFLSMIVGYCHRMYKRILSFMRIPFTFLSSTKRRIHNLYLCSFCLAAGKESMVSFSTYCLIPIMNCLMYSSHETWVTSEKNRDLSRGLMLVLRDFWFSHRKSHSWSEKNSPVLAVFLNFSHILIIL